MADKEVGRWSCDKCGSTIVAVAYVTTPFKGLGAFTGTCPWECGRLA